MGATAGRRPRRSCGAASRATTRWTSSASTRSSPKRSRCRRCARSTSKWFRVEVNGIENVPDTGPALLVANHAGGLWPLDAAMTAVAVRLEHPDGRLPAPARRRSAVRHARRRHAGTPLRRHARLSRGHRPVAARRRTRRRVAGRLQGHRQEVPRPLRVAALRTGRVRAQRDHRCARRSCRCRSSARRRSIRCWPTRRRSPALLGLPYFPITPTFPWLGPLGLVPLPSKWYLEFGEPIDTTGLDAADPVAVFETTDHVRETIQATLDRLLAQRRSIWR